ncbi:MAG TPA: hypothetical protein VNM89_00330 [Solirubrobacterales bacterium]|nr:hypothetical protein [Solirubrobacterales bacterium]
MTGTRGFGRIVAMGFGLAVALLLLVAGEAKAGKYQVAQCGWYVGADANWADTTGGVKFRPDAWCVPPAGQDPFDGVHLKSFVREGQGTVSGTRFARWRWEAPAGTGISQVSGTWWHALHDGMEHRLGVGTWSGGFNVFAAAGATDTAARPFVAGFNPAQPAFEDRLLCAKAESKWCSLSPQSWSGVRALTITIQDDLGPGPGIGGDVLAGGWRRGAQGVGFWGGDTGGGIRFGETFVDGGRVNLTEYPCAKSFIGGEWRATQMRPCQLGVSGGASIATTSFSDGPHTIGHCVTDFAGNVGCTPNRTFHVDNNPPAHPRRLTLAGGEEWRGVNDFDFSWENPDQGPASPIGGAFWQITGPAGSDTGVKWAGGRGIAALADRAVSGPGLYSFRVWLRDEAGNDAPATAVDVPLRFDNVPPGVAFVADGAPESGQELPATVSASVTDAHSHPAGGEVHYRRLESDQWIDLPTRFQPGERADEGRLVAHLPESLGPGIYLFRADALDTAGNAASSNRRADGTEMVLRKLPSSREGAGPGSGRAGRVKTRIFASLRRGRRAGADLTVPFGVSAVLSGRLLDAGGAGLAGRELRVVARPSRGALAKTRVATVRTGKRGGFSLDLGAGPSRRITVNYGGDGRHEPASRPSMTLRVRGGVTLSGAPGALRTGQALRLRGRVRAAGAPIPRRGKLVAVQYLEAETGRWRPVLVTRTDHSGRFRARYRFRYVVGTAKIRLRAIALPEERWPYAPGASRPVTVRVTG